MSTIIVHANLHSIGYIYIRITPTQSACQRIKWKRERWISPWLLHKSKRHKVKDRPFAEGSRGCHALLWLDAQNLSAKERHFILPLVIGTFIMQSIAFISSISHDRIKLISPILISHTYLESNFYCFAPMTTYLEDLTQSICRYGGLSWQNWFQGYSEAQVVSLLGAKNLASMRERASSTSWIIHDNILYFRYKET